MRIRTQLISTAWADSRASRLTLVGVSLGLALAALAAFLGLVAAQPSGTVEGTVRDVDEPIPGARVRVRATDNLTFTGAQGQFTLGGLTEGKQIEVAAWSDGYYIASTFITPTASEVNLTLRRYHTQDHPDYEWISPITITSETACGNCHPMIFPQWKNNAHGEAVENARFFSLYNGTDLTGTASADPGYLIDFPGTAGNCANCHAPGAGVDGYLSTNMNAVRDVITAGISCDYCHKIGGIYLDPATSSVYPNAPGVRSQRVLRPPPGEQIFFGPYDDIHDPDTYLPVISESGFCAPCHQFSFWGTPIYASYEEWLASPYAIQGVTCQDCHMPPTGDSYFALPEKGGLEHPPERIPSHLQLGATSLPFLQDALDMRISTQSQPGIIWVTVTVSNTKAGHHIPTDHPGRHLILTVQATDQLGQPVPLVSGTRVPVWGGPQSELPGKAYAKVLQDMQSGAFPVVSYWKPSRILLDNRLPALARDRSIYAFRLPPGGGSLSVSVALRFRRLYQDLMDEKGFQDADLLLEQRQLNLEIDPHWEHFLPLVSGAISPAGTSLPLQP